MKKTMLPIGPATAAALFSISLVTITPLYAASFISDPNFAANGATLTSGTNHTSGATYSYGVVGAVDDNGTTRDVIASLNIVSTTFTNIDSVNGELDTNGNPVGSNSSETVGFQFDNRGNSASINPFLVATLSFSFADDNTAATISNLFATAFDIDSGRATTDYSDLVGISATGVNDTLVSGNTLLEFQQRTVGGTVFDTAELTNHLSEGNSNPSSTPGNNLGTDASSDNPLDYAASFGLEDASSFTLLYGITGVDSDDRSNRNINFTFSTAPLVPEPSSITLFSLSAFAFLLRRRR